MSAETQETLTWIVAALIVANLVFGEYGWIWSRKTIMRRKQDRNAARGITMMPNWTYRMPDGSKHISRTGREQDCCCGGNPKYHRSLRPGGWEANKPDDWPFED